MPYQNISQELTQAQYDAIVVKFNAPAQAVSEACTSRTWPACR